MILIAITTISLAVVGATTTTSLHIVQDSFAATKNCSPNGHNCWCYEHLIKGEEEAACSTNEGLCKKAQKQDGLATSDCFKGHA
jgi:hypothetical protein